MPVNGSFQRASSLPPHIRLENIQKSQDRWIEMYGEENENLKNEIKKLKKEIKCLKDK